MRIRNLIFTVAVLLSGLYVPAKELAPSEALQRLYRSDMNRISPAVSPRLVHTVSGESGVTAYLFSSGAAGLMVVSADDCAVPLLGYSETGTFDADAIPCGMLSWLELYSRQIDAARGSDRHIACNAISDDDDRKPLEPALTTKWGQSVPYNNLCPMQNDKRCVTGCVATAMAQVLNLYRNDAKGLEPHSYEWGYLGDNGRVKEVLEVDYPNMTYDWDNMLDSYSNGYNDIEADAVARLMYACGVAVDMGYSSGSSGAVANFVPYSLWQYFGFNEGAQCVQRDCWREYGKTWDDFVYEQLAEHGAVLYNGITSANEGHAFVCDGYSGDGYFHFNWGWEGLSDGWFRLDALSPEVQGTGGSAHAYAFNYNQNIIAYLDTADDIREFRPAISGRDKIFNISTGSVALGGKFTVTGEIINESQVDYELEFGCLLTDSEYGTEGRVIPVCDINLESCTLSTIFKKAEFPQDVEDGIWCIRPVIRWDGLDGWWTLPWNVKKDHVWAQVKDGTVTFNIDPGESGISLVETDTESMNSEWYTLQGIRVSAPREGETYIRVTPAGATKMVY